MGTQSPYPREVTVLAKETVENSLVLDVFLMARKGRLQDGRAGTYCWTQGGEEIASVHWQVEDADYLHLLYTETKGDGQSTEDFYWLWLERTQLASEESGYGSPVLGARSGCASSTCPLRGSSSSAGGATD